MLTGLTALDTPIDIAGNSALVGAINDFNTALTTMDNQVRVFTLTKMTWLDWKSVKPKKSTCWYHWGNRHQQFDWCWWQFQYRRPSNSFQYAWSNSCSNTSRSIHCSDPNWNHDNNQQLDGCFLGFGNCFPRYESYWNKILFYNVDLMNNEIELSNFAAVYNDFASAVTQLDSAFGNQILGPSTNAFLRMVWK